MIEPKYITKLIRIVDLRQCLQCDTCERSCAGRFINQRNVRNGIKIGHIIIPYACKQCDNPKCIESCKKDANRKNVSTGAVYLDRELCIGCGACARKCPFNSITMEISGKFRDSKDKDGNIKKIPIKYANRCDLCSDYKRRGCFMNCPSGTLKMLPFNLLLQSLHPSHQIKLKELFINSCWIKEKQEVFTEIMEVVSV